MQTRSKVYVRATSQCRHTKRIQRAFVVLSKRLREAGMKPVLVANLDGEAVMLGKLLEKRPQTGKELGYVLYAVSLKYRNWKSSSPSSSLRMAIVARKFFRSASQLTNTQILQKH